MAEWQRELQITKLDAPTRHVFGVLSRIVDDAGEPIVDLQGDEIPVAELEAAAKRFMLDSRAGDILHDGQTIGRTFESFVSTPEKRHALGDTSDSKAVFWHIGMEVPEHVFQRVQAGELQAFSIGGAAEVEVVD